MDKLASTVQAYRTYQAKNDDDIFDRLSSRYTVVILVVFTLVVSANAYYGNPITCWAPVHFTGSHTKFSNSYCWVRNTYYLNFEDEIPHADEPEKRQMIPYYQWVPFILIAQAVLFYFPSLFWHAFNSKAGVDADNILETAHTLMSTAKADKRETTLKFLANQMDRFLKTRHQEQQGCRLDPAHICSNVCCRVCSRRFGNFLVLLYTLSKLLYIGNVIFQLLILSQVLGVDFSSFGVEFLQSLSTDHSWWTYADSVAFPRVTFCDFNIRRLGNIHRYTLQCVLPINLYTEKMYVFLWFWMVFVLIATIIGFFVWVLRFICQGDRLRFVRNHLKLEQKIHDYDQKDLQNSEAFLNNYLKQDGAFLLRLIAHNTNNITVTELICALWDTWTERNGIYKPPDTDMKELKGSKSDLLPGYDSV